MTLQEGRGQWECFLSQEVTNSSECAVGKNQQTDFGSEGQFDEGDRESVDE
jgi:hypothetical protein